MRRLLYIVAVAVSVLLLGCTGQPPVPVVPITVGLDGRPIYDCAPLPLYPDSALTTERRALLVSELPRKESELSAELERTYSALDIAFAGAHDTFQYERISKRREMVDKLRRYISFELKKGTVSSLCQAETAVANLEAFVDYFKRELVVWRDYPGAPGVATECFDVRDFGAKGDGMTDDEPAFQRAFAKIRELKGKPCVLRLPPGEYLLMAKPNARVGGKLLLWFTGLKNCVVTGDDPETTRLVYGEYDGDGIDFRDCENVTLRNVQIYLRDNPFVHGEVESVDRSNGSIVLRHHAGSLAPDDPRLARIGHPNSCMQFDLDGHPVKRDVLWYDYRCENLGDGRYRMFFASGQSTTKTMPIDPGVILVYPDRNNSLSALRASNTPFMVYDRVWVRNGRAGTFGPTNYQPTLYKCRIFPKDPRFFLSTNADGNFTSIGTAIMHCEFSNMNDDGSNSHGKGQLFFAYNPADGKYKHGTNWSWEKPGDFVQVVSSLDGRYLMNTRVKTVETDSKNRQIQYSTFTDALPESLRSYTSLGIEPYDYLTLRKIYIGTKKTAEFPDQFYVPFNPGVGYVCCGNSFSNIRGVAVQIQSPCALVESNRIDNVYRGIELSGLLHYQEGPPPYNVTIRGNVIKNVNRGIKSGFMTLNHPPAVTTPMAMLLIEDNVIENATERPFIFQNVEDSLVRNNRIVGNGKSDLMVCRNLRFKDNTQNGVPFDSLCGGMSNHVVGIVFER